MEPGVWQKLEHGPLLLDGAMGTFLLARGVPPEQCLEALVVTRPALVQGIHTAYLAAGADIIKTHTFGANRIRLQRFGLEEHAASLSHKAVALAQAARAACGRAAWVAGNVGPVGRQVDWTSAAERAALTAAFHEQVTALAAGGVDLLLFETFSDVAELTLAIEVARACCDLPLIASLSYDAHQVTLAGQPVEATTTSLAVLGVDVIGANCSTGPAEMVTTLRQMRAAAPTARVSVAPNAGLPIIDGDGVARYPVHAADFAAYTTQFVALGAAIVGGCCGTTPEYVAAMRHAVDAARAAA